MFKQALNMLFGVESEKENNDDPPHVDVPLAVELLFLDKSDENEEPWVSVNEVSSSLRACYFEEFLPAKKNISKEALEKIINKFKFSRTPLREKDCCESFVNRMIRSESEEYVNLLNINNWRRELLLNLRRIPRECRADFMIDARVRIRLATKNPKVLECPFPSTSTPVGNWTNSCVLSFLAKLENEFRVANRLLDVEYSVNGKTLYIQDCCVNFFCSQSVQMLPVTCKDIEALIFVRYVEQIAAFGNEEEGTKIRQVALQASKEWWC